MKKSEVIALRRIIETAVQSLPDETAVKAVTLHPSWASGVDYTVGHRIKYGGKLYSCLTTHTSQSNWTPDVTAALWTVIDKTHAGTVDDPIPYEGNMALDTGLYYSQDSVVYLCTRSTEIPVYNALSELVGIYMEVYE